MTGDGRPAEVTVRFHVEPGFADLAPPTYASAGSAGADLRAALTKPLVIPPGARALVPTAVTLQIPQGWEGQVRARSGLAFRQGLALANGVGTIDSDYRGEVGVLLVNLGGEPVTLERGDRIAQLVLAPVGRARFERTEALDGSARGPGGFGSTGGLGSEK